MKACTGPALVKPTILCSAASAHQPATVIAGTALHVSACRGAWLYLHLLQPCPPLLWAGSCEDGRVLELLQQRQEAHAHRPRVLLCLRLRPADGHVFTGRQCCCQAEWQLVIVMFRSGSELLLSWHHGWSCNWVELWQGRLSETWLPGPGPGSSSRGPGLTRM